MLCRYFRLNPGGSGGIPGAEASRYRQAETSPDSKPSAKIGGDGVIS
jgi:hypothetical protein